MVNNAINVIKVNPDYLKMYKDAKRIDNYKFDWIDPMATKSPDVATATAIAWDKHYVDDKLKDSDFICNNDISLMYPTQMNAYSTVKPQNTMEFKVEDLSLKLDGDSNEISLNGEVLDTNEEIVTGLMNFVNGIQDKKDKQIQDLQHELMMVKHKNLSTNGS
jgi:hypothetical protein